MIYMTDLVITCGARKPLAKPTSPVPNYYH